MRHKTVTKRNPPNAVVLQLGEPTAVMNASLIGIAHKWQELNDGELYGALYGLDGLLKNKLLKLYPRDDFNKLNKMPYSPSAGLGSSTHSLKDKKGEIRLAKLAAILGLLNYKKIGYVFIIGGKMARENAHIISEAARRRGGEISVIHIPSSIYNDLTFTHHSPGYLSAAQFIAKSAAGIDLRNRAIRGVDIDMITAGNTGWLAAAASIAKKNFSSIPLANSTHYPCFAEKNSGPHLIYMPEAKFSTDKFLADVSSVMQKYNRAHVVVSEGIARQRAMKDLCESATLGSILCQMVEKELKIKNVRVNILQSSFPDQSEADLIEAFKAGEYAARFARQGLKNAAIVIGNADGIPYSTKIGYVDLSLAFEEDKPKIKKFPRSLIVSGNKISKCFREYIGVIKDADNATISIPIFPVMEFGKKNSKE